MLDQGFAGETNTKDRTRDGSSAASLRAVVPPYELPIKSKQEIPMVSRNLDNRCAAATNRASSPSGQSENPEPGISGAKTSRAWARMGIADRQLCE